MCKMLAQIYDIINREKSNESLLQTVLIKSDMVFLCIVLSLVGMKLK